jgi:hypothetical protein
MMLLWVTGILSSAIFGSLIGMALAGVAASPDQTALAGLLLGAPGGALAFTCFRLWRRENSHSSAMDRKKDAKNRAMDRKNESQRIKTLKYHAPKDDQERKDWEEQDRKYEEHLREQREKKLDLDH